MNEETGMTRYGLSLATLVKQANNLRQVYKANLHPGDWLIVKTCNSIYRLHVQSNGNIHVSGGWFDRKGLSPMKVKINGCTWGGSAIKIDIAAACGLCLEFGNKVITSPIQKIVLFPYGSQN
ncbi:MAG: hypothetical protein HY707_13790 [Ignavibacteriae bacterium]|nr:hypothetical protein [Ignavibacteriota bacterium]